MGIAPTAYRSGRFGLGAWQGTCTTAPRGLSIYCM